MNFAFFSSTRVFGCAREFPDERNSADISSGRVRGLTRESRGCNGNPRYIVRLIARASAQICTRLQYIPHPACIVSQYRVPSDLSSLDRTLIWLAYRAKLSRVTLHTSRSFTRRRGHGSRRVAHLRVHV